MNSTAHVVVVGGGPAGAATAWTLARNGVDTLVVDRARFPRPKPCAEYLSPQAARLLNEMGVLDGLERSGVSTLAGMRVFARDESFEGRFAADHGYRGFRDRGIAVRRERLDALLLDAARAAGARVLEGVTVQDVMRDARGHAAGVLVRDGTHTHEIAARHVVGADGLRSVVSRRLGLARRLRWPTRFAFVTHFAGIADVGDCGEMHVFDDGYCGLADVGSGVTNVAIVTGSANAARAAGDAEGFVAAWLSGRASLAARVRGAVRVSPVQVTGPFASRAPRAFAGGTTLVGDAADFYDPFTGEGIYAALRGAELLAPYVIESLRAPSARARRAPLEAYDRCRRHEFGGKWRVERIVSLAVAWPPLLAFAARRLRARRDLADLLVGVAGDFVPAREVLSARFAARLVLPARAAVAPAARGVAMPRSAHIVSDIPPVPGSAAASRPVKQA